MTAGSGVNVGRTAPWYTFALLPVLFLAAGAACAQVYPSKVIRMLTTAAGGGSDLNARLIAQSLSVALGQQVVVDNRPGSIATEAAAKAAPDGYTLLVNGSAVWLLQYLRDSVPYDALKDFAPVTLATNAPCIVAIHPSLPVKNVRELIALAKARPGQLNYVAGVIGAPPHIAGELFKARAGVNIVQVGYKGIGGGFTDVVAGQIQLMFPTAGSVIPYLKSGRLRALAVTTLEPSQLFPGMPTVAEALPGYEASAPLAVFAPAQTPAAIVQKLNQEIVRVLNAPDLREKFLNVGIEPVGGTPEQLTARMKSDMASLGKVIKDAGIRAD
jgi:tripartite-type tricarboxylate transporter receptor subunit TctC